MCIYRMSVCSQSEQESALEQREQQCVLEAERLRCEREELEAQLLEYQHSLDRLREGQKSVEREKERIEAQQRLLQSWRHNRQNSLPVTIPLDGYQVRDRGRWDFMCQIFPRKHCCDCFLTSERFLATIARAAWMITAQCLRTRLLYSPPSRRTTCTSPPPTTSTSVCSLHPGRTTTAPCTATALTWASVPASTTASTPC